MRYRILVGLFFLMTACEPDRRVHTSFYYWKTIFKNSLAESAYLHDLHVPKLYVRIMDIDADDLNGNPVPVSPVLFRQPLPDTVQIVPVIFIVNDILRDLGKSQSKDLAKKISGFVSGKIKQSGKASYHELQIDCDWTASTRDNYFLLLRQLKLLPEMKHIILSSTLRLHQLKNLGRNGIPPVDRVMLMCYNMGNLRKYGDQNSILDIDEFKKYAGDNIGTYPLPLDIGFPLFNWAVTFRGGQYAGISKRIKLSDLRNKNQFIFIGHNRYRAMSALPEFGLAKNDEVRWETTDITTLNTLAKYLSPLLKQDTLNLIYFHLDDDIIKTFTPAQLQETADLLR